ncbi:MULTISPECIES: M3 family metallopeptidase [Exiguobacterium]|uniref:M3 family metallopeptidase n=1 Tax=Exiguobacterium TaxID=33986 RepID=UPI000690874F|nr:MULTISPECIES: M3 family metallopeptidase [Exiguobacterium]MCT4779777.1 M3 family metallopeptidase [Exiguobacterium soli]
MSVTAPRWHLASLYSNEDVTRTLESIQEGIKRLQNDPGTFRSQLMVFQDLMKQSEEVNDFVYCLYAEDVSQKDIIDLLEQTEILQADLRGMKTAFEERLQKLSEDEWTELRSGETASYYLEERHAIMDRRLPPEQEQLIQALSIDGFAAWEQLYEQRFMGLRIPIDGQEVTIGQALYEATHGVTRTSRQQAATAIMKMCEKESDTFALMLNRIAGFRLHVYAKRGWDDLLTELCEQNRIKRTTLEAMLSAIDQHQSLFQSYYARKIRLANVVTPQWHDLEANTFSSARHISYTQAQELILKQFRRVSSQLSTFTKKLFDAGWVDAENRPNKSEGGFCASFPVAKESRIFMTYRGAYQDVVTLAHELGHAYHNSLLHDLTFFNQIKGTSIAETSSTFMENLVLDAVIEESEQEERLAMLEIKIQEGLKYVGVVPSLFRFEQRFYTERKQGPVSSVRLSELLLEEEMHHYGDVLAESAPFKWIYASHLYNTRLAFYNIPYTVGYLLSNQLYTKVKQSTAAFETQFEPLLRTSGQAAIEELVERHIGGDPESFVFWQQALEPLLGAIGMYLSETEALVPVD